MADKKVKKVLSLIAGVFFRNIFHIGVERKKKRKKFFFHITVETTTLEPKENFPKKNYG